MNLMCVYNSRVIILIKDAQSYKEKADFSLTHKMQL